MRRAVIALALASTLAGAPVDRSVGGAWPDARIGSGLGVQLKPERTDNDDLAQIRQYGFSYLRFDMRWADVEQNRGHYDWQAFDDFIGALRRHQLNAVIILNGGNPIYSGMVAMSPKEAFGQHALAAAPASEADINAFAAFAAAAVARYGTRDIIWEIWNEPDTAPFWPPRPDPSAFSRLASEACRRIRQANADATVIAPGLAGQPDSSLRAAELLHALLQSPAASCLNAISVHPYRLTEAPESVIAYYANTLFPFIGRNVAAGQKPLPVVSGEWGYTTTKVSEEQQANYLVRSHLSNLLSGVPLSIWYEWRDGGIASGDDEAHFGLFDTTHRVKVPAALALLPDIKDAVIEARLPLARQDCFVLRLRQPDGRHDLLAWTSNDRTPAARILRIADAVAARTVAVTPLPALVSYNGSDRVTCD